MPVEQQEKEADIFDRPAVATWRRVDLLTYAFQLRGIPTDVVVKLSLVGGPRKGYVYRLNYLIKTPSQMDVYQPGSFSDDDRLYVLRMAVTAITQHYDAAVAEGSEPKADWLVVNMAK